MTGRGKMHLDFRNPGTLPGRISVSVVVAFLLVVFAVLSWSIVEKRQFYQSAAISRMDLKTQALVDDIEQGLVATEQVLAQLSDLPWISDQILRRRALSVPALAALVHFDARDRVTASGGARAVVDRFSTLPAWWRVSLSQGIAFGYGTEHDRIVMARAVFADTGEYVGTDLGVFDTAYMADAVERHELPPSYAFALFDKNLKVLWGDSLRETVGQKLGDAAPFQNIELSGFEWQGHTHVFTPTHIIVSQQMAAYPLRLAMAVPLDVAFADWRHDLWLTVIIGGTVLVGGLGFLVVWLRMLGRQNQYSTDLYRLYQAIDQTPASFIMTDLNAQAVFVNRAFSRQTGYEREELIGQNPRILQSGHTAKDTYQEIWNSLTAGKTWRGELLNKRKDGSLYWEDALIAPLKDASDHVTHYVAFKTDITAIKAQSEQLKEIIWGTRVGTWVWHVQTGEIFINDRWAEIIGYRLDELQPTTFETWTKHTHPLDLETASEVLEGHFAGQREFYEVEIRMRHKEGHWVWILDRGQIVDRAEDGTPLRMAGTHADITARKTLEFDLARSEEKFRRLVEQAQTEYFLYSHDVDGVFQYVSPSVSSVLGYRQDEFLTHFSTYLTDNPLNEVAERHTEASIRGEAQPAYEVEIRHKDGSIRVLEVSESPVFDHGGDVVAVEGIAHDLTARKQADAKMAELRGALERSNAELEQFAYSISHDLQTPLRTVASFVQLLERRYGGQLDETGKEYIDFAVNGSKRMSNMISDLLEYSRVRTKGEPFEATDLKVAADEALENLTVLVKDLDASVAVSVLPTVQADRPQMMRLFQNLIGNALKYRRPDVAPVVTISADRQDGRWTVAVADNGIGIEERYFDHLFRLFNRIDTSVETDGTGVGLSICKRIVERHNGTIWVESTPGEGSTFFFTIPVQDASIN